MLKVFCPTTPANIKVRNKRDHTLSLCVIKAEPARLIQVYIYYCLDRMMHLVSSVSIGMKSKARPRRLFSTHVYCISIKRHASA